MFLRNRLIQFPLFQEDDLLGNSGGASGDLSKEDIVLELDKDDEPNPDDKDDKGKDKDEAKKKGKVKDDSEADEDEGKADKKKSSKDDDEDDEEVDELSELEEELDGPTDEQLELMTPVRRKDILKKYPNFFKEFPYMERAYYREQQFTELLPTIDDAKRAVASANTLAKFESELLEGNTVNVLEALKKTDSEGFNKLVDNYMPNLAKVDEKAFHHVLGNIVKQTIISMVKEGRATADDKGNSPLINAASILNQFVFGSSEFQNPTQLASDKPKADDGIKKKEQEFNERQLRTAQSELTTRVQNVIKNTISNNIDPKKSMSDYIKRNAERDALESVQSLMNRDSRFKTILDKLWQRAAESDYSKSSLDAIKSACHTKAKTLLPAVIKKARNEALKGIGKKTKETDESPDDSDDKNNRESTPRKDGQSDKKVIKFRFKEAKEVPRGMSTLEALMLDD